MQVAYKPISKPEVGVNNYQGFTPGKTEVLRKGAKPHNARPLESDIRIDHDVEIIVRDGCRLYVDIYRPADVPEDEKLPAVISWSCYGKKYSALHMLPICIWNCCVPNEALSGLEKFEGLDPVVWCPRGYAIVSVDSRGTGNSDGSIPVRFSFVLQHPGFANYDRSWALKTQKIATTSSKPSPRCHGVTAK
jgi:predicted acyl esterase